MSSKSVKRTPKKGGKSAAMRSSMPALENMGSGGMRPLQSSNKAGVSSSSRKQASSRSYLQRDPAAGPVAGAFGKTGSLSEVEDEMTHPEKDAEAQNDFTADRRRQNKRAKK
jgi:hypothetical protein